MTLDDESLLTAYLDGEIDPDERSSIESAFLADPELAEQLRRLASVRDLVAGLHRGPVLSVDLAGAVGARIGRRPTLGGIVRRSRRHLREVAVVGGLGLGLAATVLVALSLALLAPRPKRVNQPGAPLSPIVSTLEDRPAGSLTPSEADAKEARPAVDVAASAPAMPPVSGPLGRSQNPEDAAASGQGAREAEKVREMLDSPHLTRTFIVLDVLGGSARDRVEDLVRKTPRTEAAYGRITVSQGIVIDPRHPNEATVFALVMNEQELGHFQRKLKQSFPDRVEDNVADPVVVTQLTDIGQVAVLPGSRATEVVIPSELSPRIALRTDERRAGTPLENQRLPPDFDVSEDVGKLLVAGERDAVEKDDRPENSPQRRALQGGPSSMPARKEERPLVAAANEGAGQPPVAAGPLADAFARAPNLNEVPAIVLVWVTTR